MNEQTECDHSLQLQEYRQKHFVKKEKEDFVRNTAMVMFLVTSKYSTKSKPAVLTQLRVDAPKKKHKYSYFKCEKMVIEKERQPGSWFTSFAQQTPRSETVNT
ncbi:hypothetical protein AKO1_009109 [Acrasis kona]|uniref:Uncharacterized protein n=1 Tax=Acrasis kona TaxID=1008807 RepID=A0AAW2ZI52_9EUKA